MLTLALALLGGSPGGSLDAIQVDDEDGNHEEHGEDSGAVKVLVGLLVCGFWE